MAANQPLLMRKSLSENQDECLKLSLFDISDNRNSHAGIQTNGYTANFL